LRKQQSPFQKRFSACSDEEEERLVDERKGNQIRVLIVDGDSFHESEWKLGWTRSTV